MKIGKLLSLPHDILDSVTEKSFAEDCEVCTIVGGKLQRVTDNASFNRSFELEDKVESNRRKAENIERYRLLAENDLPLEGGHEKHFEGLNPKQIRKLQRILSK